MRKREFSEEQIKDMIFRYNNNNTLTDIAKVYKTTRHIISRTLKENNVQVSTGRFNQIYSVNEKYFSEIDTEKKAYILGFLFADGNICKNKNQFVLQIALKEDDKHILEEIKTELESTYPIGYRAPHGGYNNSKPQFYLRLTNEKLYNDLKELGMLTKDKFPDIKKDLQRHFIRGLFDGDGCICKYPKRNGSGEFYILAKQSLLKDITLIMSKANINFSPIKHKKADIYKIRKGGQRQLSLIYDYLYTGATMYLNRKHDIWEEITNDK